MFLSTRYLLISAAVSASLSFFALHAQAHETHSKPQHGGVVAEAASFQAELVVKQTEVIIYLSDHGKELASKGVTGKLTVLADGKTYSLTLTPKTANQLQATLTAPVKTAKFVAQITVPSKPAASVRFELK
jgi:nitrogen fixation protein FixH